MPFCLYTIHPFCRLPWVPRKPGSCSTYRQSPGREGPCRTTGFPWTGGGERGCRATGSSWWCRSVILIKHLLLSISEWEMSCSATSTSLLTLQVSWDPLGRRACLGSVEHQEHLDSVERSDKWATPVCKAWKVRLTLWGSLGLGW